MGSKALLALTVVMLLLFALFEAMPIFSGVKAQLTGISYEGRPNIAIQSPQAYEITALDVMLNFRIEKPQTSWLCQADSTDYFNTLKSVEVRIDGVVYKSLPVNSDLSLPYEYSTVITGLGRGNHTLSVIAYCEGWGLDYMRPLENRKEDYYTFQAVYFAVLSASETPTPKPTVNPAPTTSHIESLKPTGTASSPVFADILSTNVLLLIIAIALIVIACLLAIIASLQLSTRKRNPANLQG
jgi:hypothetical protein